ncbi:mRNA-decapping enzyme 1A isoform X3 [Pipistrellus kuhlii]|uniref:mRNA-decapping enzyme 1A isoform X3 n=1 Tax=Pipistrellus kuhlii TaxID=59472 RepID=UPI00174F6B4B|nr:mRNA-decapping enzyme 1A isoform X3 [Pipistrellus kuhlii]
MESLSRAGQEMSLAALKQHDPYITSIADLTGQVALYTFCPKANQWEKTDIEGTLFVYRRSASPYHGFTIVNRLNMHNLVEPVNKDLEFQLHEPFLLYRNASLSIYSIWFYDKNDCHRIAKLMSEVVEEETRRSQQAARDKQSPSQANGCNDHRPIDILEMLSRAKDEYERNQMGDSNISSPGLQPSTQLSNLGSTETLEETPSGLQDKAVGPPLVPATTAVVSSVLLSPSVFQQTMTRATDLERKASSPSPLTVGTSENQRKPSIILSKSQLQDTLIHLIKNDSGFLSTLHEVYLQVLTKNKDNHNL